MELQTVDIVLDGTNPDPQVVRISLDGKPIADLKITITNDDSEVADDENDEAGQPGVASRDRIQQ